MKTKVQKLMLSAAVIGMVYSCQKSNYDGSAEMSSDAPVAAVDSVSSVASMKVQGRQFVKTAQVDMEVKNVYDATMAIEKSLTDVGGFVVHSNLKTDVMDETTYNTSDTEAMLVRKFQSRSLMEVRVPTAALGIFLKSLNDTKVFLNSRLINAEDLTSSIKLAEMEAQRNRRTAENIAQLKINENKVLLSEGNQSEKNSQEMEKSNLAHDLKYSVVQLVLKEPGISVAQIPVANVSGADRLYSVNFWYDAKNALAGGYELLQLLIIGILRIWPLLLIVGGLIWLMMKKQKAQQPLP